MPNGIHNWRFIDIKRFLSDNNFRLNYVEGSHYFFIGTYNNSVRQVCVPFHGAKAVNPKTMKSIIVQSGIPLKEWK